LPEETRKHLLRCFLLRGEKVERERQCDQRNDKDDEPGKNSLAVAAEVDEADSAEVLGTA